MTVDELVANARSTLEKAIEHLESREFTPTERQYLVSVGFIGTTDQDTANAMIEEFVQTAFVDPVIDIYSRETYRNIQELSKMSYEEYREYTKKTTSAFSDVVPEIKRVFKAKILDIFN